MNPALLEKAILCDSVRIQKLEDFLSSPLKNTRKDSPISGIFVFEDTQSSFSEFKEHFKQVFQKENALLFYVALKKYLALNKEGTKKDTLRYLKDIYKSIKDVKIKESLKPLLKAPLIKLNPPFSVEEVQNELERLGLSLPLLRVFHTFVLVEIGLEYLFSPTLSFSSPGLTEHFRGIMDSEKIRKRLQREISTRFKDFEKNLGAELSSLNEKSEKISEEMKETITLQTRELERAIVELINRGKHLGILHTFREHTSKMLRSLSILLFDYQHLNRDIKRKKFHPDNFVDKALSHLELPHLDFLREEWNWYIQWPKTPEEKKKTFESYFFEAYSMAKKENRDTHYFEQFIEKKFLVTECRFFEIEDNLRAFFEDLIDPLLYQERLFKGISFFPDLKEKIPDYYRSRIPEWVVLKELPEQRYYLLDTGESVKRDPFEGERANLSQWVKENFGEGISVLVYDIRGSTFMSLKLLNPKKEREIKNMFNKEMLKIIRKYDGFPVKDIGDGGIVWFGENSKEIYSQLFEEGNLPLGGFFRFQKSHEKEFPIRPSREASSQALLCAKEMLSASRSFIKEKYSSYRDWFPDVIEDYPPLKALFRIGVGITSGKPFKDIAFGYNSFGDVDVVGPLINIGILLSQGKDPLESLVYIDHNTLFSLLLNSEDWEIYAREKSSSDADKFYIIKKLLKEFRHPTVFRFPSKGIEISLVGRCLLDEPDKTKSLIFEIPDDIDIDEKGTIRHQGKNIKLIYEVRKHLQ